MKNGDLWAALDAAASRHKLTWRWVEGHSGHLENTRADLLARSAIPKGTRSGG